MQLMPDTAFRYGVRDTFDPAENVSGGARHIAYLLGLYNGDLTRALAAYNAGQANVDAWRARGIGIQFDETKEFVGHVESLKRTYRHAYSSLRAHNDT